jgi:hypothetical protein
MNQARNRDMYFRFGSTIILLCTPRKIASLFWTVFLIYQRKVTEFGIRDATHLTFCYCHCVAILKHDPNIFWLSSQCVVGVCVPSSWIRALGLKVQKNTVEVVCASFLVQFQNLTASISCFLECLHLTPSYHATKKPKHPMERASVERNWVPGSQPQLGSQLTASTKIPAMWASHFKSAPTSIQVSYLSWSCIKCRGASSA